MKDAAFKMHGKGTCRRSIDSTVGRMAVLTTVSATLLGAALLIGCRETGPRPRAQAFLASAMQYLDKRDAPAALIELKNALQENPELAEARLLLGRALLDTGKPAEAVVELRKALALNHPAGQTVPALARALLAAGEWRKLISEHASTLLTDPLADADLKASLAQAYFNAGEDRRADALLAEALKAAPDSSPARMLQARRLASTGQLDAALDAMARLVQAHPDDALAWVLRGDLMVLSKQRRPDAIASYGKALALQPRLLSAHNGLLYELMADPGSDHEALSRAFAALKAALPGHPQTTYFEAALAVQRHDLGVAGRLAEQLLRQAPDDPNYMRLAGTVALAAGEVRKAEGLLTQALQLAPNNPTLRRLLASAHLQAGEPEHALTALGPLLQGEAVDTQALRMAAAANAQLGRFRQSPPRQNSCRFHRTSPGAAMKDGLGSIRTGIQGQSGGEGVAAGERSAGGGGARSWNWSGNPGALARGCAVQGHPRACLDCGRPA